MITCPPRLRRHRRWAGSSVGKTSGSTCTTWRGGRTTGSREPDPLEDALGDLVRAAQEDLDVASGAGASEAQDKGELVERRDFVSFVLMVAGYRPRDFQVSVVRDELRVEAPDFELTRALGCRVDADRVRAEYRNGVLSVRLAKKP